MRVLDEMAYVRNRIDVPLLANEASWTRHAQLAVIRACAADAISIDNQMDGGLANLRRSAGMCETAKLPVVKHSLGELGVALAAAVHALAATPNARPAHQAYGARLSDDVVGGFGGPAANYADGHLTVPPARASASSWTVTGWSATRACTRTEGAGFGFHDRERVYASAALPKF